MEVAVPTRRLIADRAYEEMRDQIVTLKLPPGKALREEEMMASLDVGRTPLRDAIKRLSLEGLVTVQARRGTVVTDVQIPDIVHVTEVRLNLEVLSAELAARRLDDDTRVLCEGLLDEVRNLGDGMSSQDLMRFDERIHRFVWEGSSNPFLVATLGQYFTLSLRIWYFVLERVPGLGVSVHNHAELLTAILRKDAATAGRLMRDHVLEFERETLASLGRN